MRTVIIIPARFHSSRFPGKPLANILGKPLVEWVAELSSIAVGKENVYVATDDQRIESFVKSINVNCIMTSYDHLTGTDRVAEASNYVEADIYVNVQGDEPLVNPNDIKKIINEKVNSGKDVIKGYCVLTDFENPENVNIPKIIFSDNGYLVYASRSVIPGSKKKIEKKIYKAGCIYAFDKNNLNDFLSYGKKSKLEEVEDIEILRFLELGTNVKMVETEGNSLAVDIPSDIYEIEKFLKEKK